MVLSPYNTSQLLTYVLMQLSENPLKTFFAAIFSIYFAYKQHPFVISSPVIVMFW